MRSTNEIDVGSGADVPRRLILDVKGTRFAYLSHGGHRRWTAVETVEVPAGSIVTAVRHDEGTWITVDGQELLVSIYDEDLATESEWQAWLAEDAANAECSICGEHHADPDCPEAFCGACWNIIGYCDCVEPERITAREWIAAGKPEAKKRPEPVDPSDAFDEDAWRAAREVA